MGRTAPSDTTIPRLIPRHLVARAISFDCFSDAAARPVSLALIGPLTTHLGMPTPADPLPALSKVGQRPL